VSPLHATPCQPPPGRAAAACGAWVLGLIVALGGCSSSPKGPRDGAPALPRPSAGWPERDGADANPPPDLHLVPDAEPRIEPVRPGGPNKPYEVLGQAYVPLQGDPPLLERGLASWYGRKFHGRRTATGEPYDMYAMTAAHRTMPLPSYAVVRNPANGRAVVVRVNDRGPFHAGRVIDLSYTAALKLGLLGGVAPVEVERITHEALRSGLWRPPDAATGLAAAPARARPGSTGVATPAGAAARPAPVVSLPEPAGGVADPIAAFADPVAPPAASAGFWLQLGAFRDHGAALGLQQRMARDADWLAPRLAIVSEPQLHRLRAGPYASRGEALQAAERLRGLLPQTPPVLEQR
jgi:rare lipoprotein A